MQLRDYQTSIITQVYAAWDEGHQNVLAQLATGGGKTVILSKIVSDVNAPTVVVVHRSELVSQISLTLARFGIYHDIIAQRSTIRNIVSLHHIEQKRSYYRATAQVHVASVDSLIREPAGAAWMRNVELLIVDEAAHVLRDNKWGKACELFERARGFFPTATPCRGDGRGLGRQAHGVIDKMIIGVSMRDLINQGYLTPYRIFAPYTAIDLNNVPVTASGDYSMPKLRGAVHKSKIVGDVVSHYKRIAAGKLGITFAVDVASAAEIAHAFRKAGVSAEIITAKTPDLERHAIMRKFRNREIMQLVNVDILGEGVDVPAVEVVSMARPTQSYSLFAQQFGRVLRTCGGKTHGLIIDHVDNCLRHGLPDSPRIWTLESRTRKERGTIERMLELKTCQKCTAVFEKYARACPYCEHVNALAGRATIEQVDGDLRELDLSAVNALMSEIDRIDGLVRIPAGLAYPAKRAIENMHTGRQLAQGQLRDAIAKWAGVKKHEGLDDSSIYRLFYAQFGIDILTAQTLGAKDARELMGRIEDAC
jgi:superfamily II DNA or RNA helicase